MQLLRLLPREQIMLVTISRSKIIVPVLLKPRCGGLLLSSNYSARYSHQIKMSTSASTSSCSPATADLCDDHVTSPTRLSVMGSGEFRDYGGVKSFHGKIETVRCFESNPMVRKTLMEPGNGRVLVVDGGGAIGWPYSEICWPNSPRTIVGRASL